MGTTCKKCWYGNQSMETRYENMAVWEQEYGNQHIGMETWEPQYWSGDHSMGTWVLEYGYGNGGITVEYGNMGTTVWELWYGITQI